MKNILAENMRRFRTKNLNENVMEGFLSELEQKIKQNPQLTIKFTPPSSGMYKTGADGYPLVVQSLEYYTRPGYQPTDALLPMGINFSVAYTAQGDYGTEDEKTLKLKKIQQDIYKMSKQDYIFSLWCVRYSTAFKSRVGANYNTICDYLFSKFPLTQRKVGNNPISAVHNYFYDPALGKEIARHLRQFNVDEKELTY